MRRIRPTLLALVALLVGLTACTRSVDFDPDPGSTYAVNVVNPSSQPMIVSFDDGSGPRLLGTVGANRTERFVVAASQGGTVSIIAHDEAETRTVRKTVVLEPGGTVEVRLD